MKISKINQSLILISAVAVVLDLARIPLWGTASLFYLVWNLFLAWIPYLVSSFLIKKGASTNSFIPVFIFWFLFFPNAPYLVTDILHIVSISPPLLWYDSLLLFFFGWIGLLLGMLSLFQVHQYLKNHLSGLVSEVLIFIICFISSFGVYLGRFKRWNSWDVFINPFHLIKDSFDLSSSLVHTGNSLLFVAVFTIFIYAVYHVMYVLISDKIEL